MKKYVFLFSISPVQAYIEQARKTQDLYAGSYMLSHLCHTAMKKSGLEPKDIIFPFIEQDDDNYSLPNRFLAIVEKEEAELQGFGERVEKAVKAEFEHIAEIVISEIKTPSESELEQVRNFLTVNWLFLPLNGDYEAVYEEIERFFGAIKRVRIFQQIHEKGRKCSVCGERNVNFYHKTDQESQLSANIPSKLFTEDVYVAEYDQFNYKFLQPGEALCAVCYMKRGAEKYFPASYNSNFPSTAEVALLDAFNKLPDNIRPGKDTPYDPQIIFSLLNKRSSSNLRKEYSHEQIQNSKKLLKVFYNYNITFSPYYAVLRFDGDSMGKWLSGVYCSGFKFTEQDFTNLEDEGVPDDEVLKFLKPLKNKDYSDQDEFLKAVKKQIGQEQTGQYKEHILNHAQIKLENFHRNLSQQLRKFAHKAEKHFKIYRSQGCAVYAGGDDFLGFVNLRSLFTVMKQLRQEFDGIDLHEFTERKLTFSAGVVIAHYKTPLSEVLKWSRRMEHAAKEIDEEKDAFAIAVLKHSGEIHKTIFKWRENEIWTTDIFENLMQQLREEIFSSKFITNLDREFRLVMDHQGKLADRRGVESEIRRLITRACQMRRQKDESPNEFRERKDNAIKKMISDIIWLNTRSRHSFENFLAALNIIDFLVRKVAVQDVREEAA